MSCSIVLHGLRSQLTKKTLAQSVFFYTIKSCRVFTTAFTFNQFFQEKSELSIPAQLANHQ